MLSEDKRIKTKEQLREYLDAELGRYPMRGRRYIAYFLQISEGAILRRHTILLRKTEYYLNSGRKLRGLWYYARLMRLQNKYCLHFPINCFGKGLSITHVAPMMMNGEVTVGENFHVSGMSSLAYSDGKHEGVPTVGDNVTLGLGAIVRGNVTIADGVTIGAGTLVTRSFTEKGVTVAGVPARIIGGDKPGEAER